MKLPIIQSLWIGNPLSNLEKLCVQSFLDHGHQFHLYTYAEIGGVPSGAVIKDANQILPESKIFKASNGSFASFSDWFRYALLVEHGGFWVDMDIACIKPFEFDADLILCDCYGGGYTTCVIGAPPNHPLMRSLNNACNEFKKREGSKYGAVGGPGVLTKHIYKLDLHDYVKSFTYFVPVGGTDWLRMFDRSFPDGVQLFPNTYSVHFEHDIGRRLPNFSKNAVFDSDSLFEQLKAKHNIHNAANAPRLSSQQLYQLVNDNKSRKRKNRLTIGLAVLATLIGCFALALWL